MTTNVEALFKYSYEYDGKTISFQKGEKFSLIKKVNGDWWQVNRKHDNGVIECIYVPANYMKEVEDPSVKSHTYQNMADLHAEYQKARESIKKQHSGSGLKKNSPKLSRMKSLDSNISSGQKSNGSVPSSASVSPTVVVPPSEGVANNGPPLRTVTEPEYAVPTPPMTRKEEQETVKPIAKEWQLGYSLPQNVKKRSVTVGADSESTSLDTGSREETAQTPNHQFQSILNSQLSSGTRPLSTLNAPVSSNVKSNPAPKPKPKHSSLPRPKSFCVDDEVPSTPSTFAPPSSAGLGGSNKLTQNFMENMNRKSIKKSTSDNEESKPHPSSPGVVIPVAIPGPLSPTPLPEGWSEHKTAEGKVYYYNCITKESKWTRPIGSPANPVPPPPPPEESPAHQSTSVGGSPKLSPVKKISSSPLDSLAPRGWTKEINPLTQTPIFTNSRTLEKWALANDDSGHFYYLTSNSSVRLQNLPPIMDDTSETLYDHLTAGVVSKTTPNHEYAELDVSMKSPLPQSSDFGSSQTSRQLQDLWSSAMTTTFLRKHGYLHRKRVIDVNSKKLRSEKWVKLFVSLQSNQLMFYSDHRTKDQPGAKPVSTFNLLHSSICLINYKDKKKQVIQISSSTGEQFCLEAENSSQMNDWYSTIQTAIVQTNEDYKMNPSKYSGISTGGGVSEPSPPLQNKFPRKGSSQLKDFDDIEEIEQLSGAEKTVRIKGRLRNLIARRPQVDTLKKTGIIMEPMFGCPIDVLAAREHRPVPLFLENLINHIEKKGMNVVGIYRLSGNASQVQKLRYLLEENPRADLSGPDWTDINVLTGCLKLYFRELPDPLIPFKFYRSVLNSTTLPIDKRPQAIAIEISKFPEPNYATLKFLIKHLSRVVEHSHVNKMLANNLGIVFGPTLMRSEVDSLEIASLMPLQNNVVETIITEEAQIFRK